MQTSLWWRFHLDAQLLEADRAVWVEYQRLRDRKRTKQADKLRLSGLHNSLDIVQAGLIVYPVLVVILD